MTTTVQSRVSVSRVWSKVTDTFTPSCCVHASWHRLPVADAAPTMSIRKRSSIMASVSLCAPRPSDVHLVCHTSSWTMPSKTQFYFTLTLDEARFQSYPECNPKPDWLISWESRPEICVQYQPSANRWPLWTVSVTTEWKHDMATSASMLHSDHGWTHSVWSISSAYSVIP